MLCPHYPSEPARTLADLLPRRRRGSSDFIQTVQASRKLIRTGPTCCAAYYLPIAPIIIASSPRVIRSSISPAQSQLDLSHGLCFYFYGVSLSPETCAGPRDVIMSGAGQGRRLLLHSSNCNNHKDINRTVNCKLLLNCSTQRLFPCPLLSPGSDCDCDSSSGSSTREKFPSNFLRAASNRSRNGQGIRYRAGQGLDTRLDEARAAKG